MEHGYNGGINCLTEVKTFLYPQLNVTYSVYVHIRLADSMALWGVFAFFSILAGFTCFRAKFQYHPCDCISQVYLQNTAHKARIPQNV